MTSWVRMDMLSTISREKRSTLQLRVWLHLAVAVAGLHLTCRLADPSAAASILHSSYSVVWFVYFHKTGVLIVTNKRCAVLRTRKTVQGSSRGGRCGVWHRLGGGCRNRWTERCGKDDDDGDACWSAKADVGGISNSGCPGGTGRAAPDSVGVQLQQAGLPRRIRVSEAIAAAPSLYRAPVAAEQLLADMGLTHKPKDFISKFCRVGGVGGWMLRSRLRVTRRFSCWMNRPADSYAWCVHCGICPAHVCEPASDNSRRCDHSDWGTGKA